MIITNIRACMHACMRTCIHTCIRTYVHTYVRTYMFNNNHHNNNHHHNNNNTFSIRLTTFSLSMPPPSASPAMKWYAVTVSPNAFVSDSMYAVDVLAYHSIWHVEHP